MIRRRNAILLALGLLAPLALVDSPAGAIDQDLVAATTAGPPGTAVEVASASCTSTDTQDAYLEVALIVGTAPGEQLAGIGQGYDGVATVTVPDWVDPDQPAVLEANCSTYDQDGNDDYLEYDPIAFDIEPGAGTPVQVRTFSRTELLAGQGIRISGSCGPTLGNGFVQAIVVPGTDQSGRDLEESAGDSYADTAADGSFDLDLAVTNAYVGLNVGSSPGGPDVYGVEESPMDVPEGDYTVITYCSADDEGSYVMLQPEGIVVTGAAPTNGIDLTTEAGTRNVTLAGTCEAGAVEGGFEPFSTEDLGAPLSTPTDVARTPARAQVLRQAEAPSSAKLRGFRTDGLVRTNGTDRAIPVDEFTPFTATPDAAGAWSVADSTSFDNGIVISLGICGDPLADGYVYDPQGVVVEVAEVPPTVPPTVPVTTPPAPADAVSGTPTYAG